MKKPLKIVLIIVAVVIVGMAIVAITDYIRYSGEGYSGGPPVYEKPPQDPVAKKEWMADKIYSSTFDYKFFDLGYKVPSALKLKALKTTTSLQRHYPEKMSTVLEYGSVANLANLLYFGEELQDLGVNTYIVFATYHLREGELEFFMSNLEGQPDLLNDSDSKKVIAHSILLAKKLGFTVILGADYFDLEDGGMKNMNNPENLEQELEKITLELAEIAEEYGVEYVTTDNQMGMILVTNGYPVSEAQKRTNAYRAQIVPKIREIYDGKIMYKTSGLNNWENMKGISMVGADIFGFTGCYANEPWYISNDIKKMAQVADEISARDGVPWMNIEFFVRSAEDQMRDLGYIKTNQPIEEYYKSGLKSFKTHATNAKGFTFAGWSGSGSIRGSEAVPLLKNFFAGY